VLISWVRFQSLQTRMLPLYVRQPPPLSRVLWNEVRRPDIDLRQLVPLAGVHRQRSAGPEVFQRLVGFRIDPAVVVGIGHQVGFRQHGHGDRRFALIVGQIRPLRAVQREQEGLVLRVGGIELRLDLDRDAGFARGDLDVLGQCDVVVAVGGLVGGLNIDAKCPFRGPRVSG